MRAELKKRVERAQQKARASIAKRGFMQFRCKEEDILRLNDLAKEKNLPVGAMIREWVLEHLAEEERQALSVHEELKKPNKHMFKIILDDLENIRTRLEKVESKTRITS